MKLLLFCITVLSTTVFLHGQDDEKYKFKTLDEIPKFEFEDPKTYSEGEEMLKRLNNIVDKFKSVMNKLASNVQTDEGKKLNQELTEKAVNNFRSFCNYYLPFKDYSSGAAMTDYIRGLLDDLMKMAKDSSASDEIIKKTIKEFEFMKRNTAEVNF